MQYKIKIVYLKAENIFRRLTDGFTHSKAITGAALVAE